MHEMGIACEIARIAESEARAAGLCRVTSVTVRVGALSGVLPDSLLFCFDAASRGTLAEGAALRVERPPCEARCALCGRVFAPEDALALCPGCEVPAGHVSGGRELEVVRVTGEKGAVNG